MDKAYDRAEWTQAELTVMRDSYLSAALWSSTDDDGESLDELFGVGDFNDGDVTSAQADLEDFYEANQAALVAWTTPRDAGLLFWLNRNGHGAGFWDRTYTGAVNTAEYRDRYGLSEDQAAARVEFNAAMDRLSDAAKAYGGVDVYVGDDGRVHAQ